MFWPEVADAFCDRVSGPVQCHGPFDSAAIDSIIQYLLMGLAGNLMVVLATLVPPLLACFVRTGPWLQAVGAVALATMLLTFFGAIDRDSLPTFLWPWTQHLALALGVGLPVAFTMLLLIFSRRLGLVSAAILLTGFVAFVFRSFIRCC